MRTLSDTQKIFHQLADTEGSGGVKVVIENHDAWVHNDNVEASIIHALRMYAAKLARDPERAARIERQSKRLQQLVTPLRKRISSAG